MIICIHNWRDCVDSKGAASMKALKGLFTSVDWWKLVPDQKMFDGWAPRGNAAAVSEDCDFAVVYFANRADLPLRVGRVGGGSSVRAVWIDPESGGRLGECTVKGDVHRFCSPACCDDAVLLLTKN